MFLFCTVQDFDDFLIVRKFSYRKFDFQYVWFSWESAFETIYDGLSSYVKLDQKQFFILCCAPDQSLQGSKQKKAQQETRAVF